MIRIKNGSDFKLCLNKISKEVQTVLPHSEKAFKLVDAKPNWREEITAIGNQIKGVSIFVDEEEGKNTKKEKEPKTPVTPKPTVPDSSEDDSKDDSGENEDTEGSDDSDPDKDSDDDQEDDQDESKDDDNSEEKVYTREELENLHWRTVKSLASDRGLDVSTGKTAEWIDRILEAQE